MSSSDLVGKRKKRSAKRRSLLPLLIFFIIVLMAASCFLIFLIRNHAAASVGIDTTTKLSAQSGFACEYSEAQKLYPFSDGILKVTATRVAYLSMSGTEVYGVDIKMDKPFCVINGQRALIADSGGYFCMLLDSKGEIYQKQMTGAISFGALSKDGLVGLIMEQTDTKGAVYLLDATGEFLAQWNSVESGYPVAISFSPNQAVVDIALVDTDGSSMQPRLKQIGLPTGDGDKKPKDLALYTPDVSSILSSISYLGNDKTILAGISDLLCFSGDKIQSISNYGQIFSVISVGDGIVVIFSDGLGQEVRIEYIGSDFVRGNSFVLGNSFIDAQVKDGKVLIAVDDKILLLDAATLKTEKSVTVDQEILKIGFNSDGTVVAVTADSVRNLTI
jgi:hypothetical protein